MRPDVQKAPPAKITDDDDLTAGERELENRRKGIGPAGEWLPPGDEDAAGNPFSPY